VEKTRDAIHHTKRTLEIIEDMKKTYLPTLLQMLTNEIMPPSDAPTTADDDKETCEFCNKEFKKGKGMNVHKSKCKEKPTTPSTSVVIDQTPMEPLEKGQTTLLAHFSGPPSVINIE
jgi:hypothetical protein